jgi:hypothetical protein
VNDSTVCKDRANRGVMPTGWIFKDLAVRGKRDRHSGVSRRFNVKHGDERTKQQATKNPARGGVS